MGYRKCFVPTNTKIRINMKINLNTNFLDLDGIEVIAVESGQPINIGKALAHQIHYGTPPHPVKMGYWADKLHAGEELDLDPTDVDILKAFVSSPQNALMGGVKRQILTLLK